MARPGVKIPKGELCDLARKCEKYTGENTGRRLRYFETCYDVKVTPKDEPEHVQARALLNGGRASELSTGRSTPLGIGLSHRAT